MEWNEWVYKAGLICYAFIVQFEMPSIPSEDVEHNIIFNVCNL